MAIVFAQQKRIRQYMILGIGILTLVAAVVIWQEFLRGGTGTTSQISFPPARTVKINIEILDSPLFEEIQDPSPPLSIPENIGRENPFIPL